jgi:hypothetical protein
VLLEKSGLIFVRCGLGIGKGLDVIRMTDVMARVDIDPD